MPTICATWRVFTCLVFGGDLAPLMPYLAAKRLSQSMAMPFMIGSMITAPPMVGQGKLTHQPYKPRPIRGTWASLLRNAPTQTLLAILQRWCGSTAISKHSETHRTKYNAHSKAKRAERTISSLQAAVPGGPVLSSQTSLCGDRPKSNGEANKSRGRSRERV